LLEWKHNENFEHNLEFNPMICMKRHDTKEHFSSTKTTKATVTFTQLLSQFTNASINVLRCLQRRLFPTTTQNSCSKLTQTVQTQKNKIKNVLRCLQRRSFPRTNEATQTAEVAQGGNPLSATKTSWSEDQTSPRSVGRSFGVKSSWRRVREKALLVSWVVGVALVV